MVSQADRDLIRDFVTELRPYLETVGHGVQEFAQPTRDGVIIGQAIQALGMIRGAGSILMVDGLVTIVEMLSDAFEIIQRNPDIPAADAARLLAGLTVPLEGYLMALDRGDDTSTYLIQARAAYDSIPVYRGPIPGTASLAGRADLDTLFGDTAPVTRDDAGASAPTVAFSLDDGEDRLIPTDAGQSTAEDVSDQATDQVILDEGATQGRTIPLQSREPESPQPLSLPHREAGERPPRVIPEQALETERLPEIDPELREIFIEEAATLVISFGENAKSVAHAPADYERVSELRRDAHTLKGAANMTGFPLIGRLGAGVELLLDEHIDREIPVNRETLELVLVSWKMLRAMLARLDHLDPFVSPVASVVQRAEELRRELAGELVAVDLVVEEPAQPEIEAMKKLGTEPEPPAASAELPDADQDTVEDVVITWDPMPEVKTDIVEPVSPDMEDTAQMVTVDDQPATVVLGAEPEAQEPPVDAQVEDEWLSPPDWSIENDQAHEPAVAEEPQAETLNGEADFWSPVAEDDDSEQYTDTVIEADQWTPEAEAGPDVDGAASDDEIVVVDPFRVMVGDEVDEPEPLSAYAPDAGVTDDEFWSPVDEVGPGEDVLLEDDESDASWITEEEPVVEDEPASQAEPVAPPVPDPLWDAEESPTPDALPLEGEVGPEVAEPFWRPIDDEHFHLDEPLDEPVAEDLELAQGLAESAVADTFEASVEPQAGEPEDAAADEDLATSDGGVDVIVEDFWCPEELLVEERAGEQGAGHDANSVAAEAAVIESDDDVVEDFASPEWLGEFDANGLEPDQAASAGDEVLVVEPIDDGFDAGSQPNGPGALPLDIQELRDRSRSAELGSALLDLAFSAESGPAAGDTATEASIAVLDENAEAQLALEMFETFALECTDHVEALNLAAMQLDRNPQLVEPLREVKRALHTLKGAAAAAEFDAISERCHRLEDSLGAMERPDGTVARPFVEDLFTAIEDIERMLEARRVELFGADEEVATDETLSARQSLRVELSRIDALLNTVGELVVNRAGLEQRLERLSATLEELSLTASRLQRSGFLLERERYADDPIARFVRGELMPFDIAPDGSREFPADWDELEMDRYTEFDRLIRQLSEVGADVGTAVNEIAQLRGDLDTISTRQRRLTTNLQDELMDVRMVPIASMAPRLYRVVRRVARSRDKLVNLVLEGGETPFDKMLLDALSEPLLHLLRNAVDHGIEPAGERRGLGKPETGTIKIRAYRDGNEAVIDILDDGAGIDPGSVLERARELGMPVADDITNREALQFIFLPGLSTRSTADEVSGRGVGLDIVEQTITRYKGRVAVDSIPGQGTVFSLRLPVMLAVTQAFLVVAGGARYAIPIANIESVVDREDQPLTLIGETVVVEQGDVAIPVVDLSARFGRVDAPVMERESGWVMIAEVDGQRWALVVDELHGQQEVVVRPLGRFLRATPGMMGATILGNGDVALIIDVPQLFSDRTRVAGPGAMIYEEHPALPEAPATASSERASVALVVDDSLSVRRVVGRTLERHGWTALLARDGVEALELLEDGPVDVVITDIEMPRMDGFDLLTSVRARRNLRDLPVIVLTSRSGEKHRGRAFELGANGYLVKPFQEQELIEMVAQSSRLAAVGAD